MKHLLITSFCLITFNLLANTFVGSDTINLTVSSEKLSYSDIESLLDKNIEVILNINTSKSDIQSLVSSYKEKIIINGSGFSYIELNNYINSGARIILDRSCPNFDIKQLVSIGGENVIIIGKGFDTFELESYLSSGASVVVDRNHFGMIYTWVDKYTTKIIISAKDYTLFELTNWIKQGAGVWMNFAPPVYDIRSYLKLTSTYGGTVFLNAGVSYFDIQTILQ